MTELEKAIQETAEAALGMIKKSQMAFDFSAPNAHDHHKAYDRVNASGTVSHIQQKGSLTGLPKELHDKIQAGTHRLVAAVDGSIASLERKHPQTGEWLIGTKVRQDVAKKMIPHLEKLPNVNDPYGAIGRYVAPAPEAPAKPTTYDEGLEMTDNLRNQIKQLEIQKLAIPADTRVATELDAATKLDVQMRELHKEMERVTKHMMTLV